MTVDATYLRGLASGLRNDHANGDSPGSRLCAACVERLDLGAAGIMLMDGEAHGTSLGASSAATRVVEDLQFTLGEGPGIDAHARGRPSLGPSLGDESDGRWPAFAAAALDAGFRAAFGFPLRVGAVRIGALDFYDTRPTRLSRSQMDDAVVLADFIALAVIAIHADADPGELVAEMDNPRDLRTQVHQASGMMSEQLDIGIGDALVRLRAYAYAAGRPIDEVAEDVVIRRLHLP